jgi:hypothetical protein
MSHTALGTVLIVASVVVFEAGAAGQIVTTGSLRIEAEDENRARLAGVAVTVSSPSLIGGTMTRETSALGQAMFPALPPGTYSVTFRLDGFQTVVRDQIVVDAGLSYRLRVAMVGGSADEVHRISGGAPVIDDTTAESGSSMDADHLEAIPTSRDIWAVMQQAPRMRMERFDVGGSTTGTQTGYKNFGFGDQNRPMLDGVNLTEGTSGSGFYFDYGSFEQVLIAGMGNTSEAPTPGTMYTMVIKSGGNAFSGMFFQDYQHPSFAGENLTEEIRDRGISRADELKVFYTTNFNVGGPVLANRAWFFAGGLLQTMEKTRIGYELRPGDPTVNERVRGWFTGGGKLAGTHKSTLVNPTLKVTLLPTPQDRIVLFEAGNFKSYPERGGDALVPVESTYFQYSYAYGRKVGWMRAFSDRALLDVTLGNGGYRWPSAANSIQPAYQDVVTREFSGTNWGYTAQRNYNPGRWQIYPTLTLFVPDWLGGNHDFKFGASVEKYGADMFFEGHVDNVRHFLYDGAAYQVDLMNTPTSYEYWTWTQSFFLHDTFTRGRFAFNLGVRFDAYRADLPDMEFPGNNWAGVNPMFGPQSFPGQTGVVDWKNFAPRLGVVARVGPRTVVKVNYGRYWFFPGLLSASANKNTLGGAIYQWNDLNGNLRLDPGELGPLVREYGGARAEVDPNLKQPWADEVFVSVDHELLPNFFLRGIYLYKGVHEMWQTYNAAWPTGMEGYIPVPVQDLDELGRPTGGTFTLYNLRPEFAGLSRDRVASLGAYDYNHNLQLVARKRMSGGWQLMSSLDLTWEEEPKVPGPTVGYGTPTSPNGSREGWDVQRFLNGVFKASGTIMLPYQTSVSPVLRYQLGQQWGRRAVYRNFIGPDGRPQAFTQGAVHVWMEDQSNRRRPNVTLLDFRVEKSFQIGAYRAGGMFDLFNVFNSNAMTSTTDMTGASFDRWTEILMPRIFRVGFRVTF